MPASFVLVKVVRPNVWNLHLQRFDLSRLHRYHVVLMLQDSLDQKKWELHQWQTILFEKLRCHDDVRDSRFVLHAQEYESFRRAGTLTHDHPTGNFHPHSVSQISELTGRYYFHRIQPRALMRHRMAADRDARAA